MAKKKDKFSKRLEKKLDTEIQKVRKELDKDITIYSILFGEFEVLYKDYREDLLSLTLSIKNDKYRKKVQRAIKSNKLPYKKMAKTFAKELKTELNKSTGLKRISKNRFFYAEDTNGYHFILIPEEEGKNRPYGIVYRAIKRIRKKEILLKNSASPDRYVSDLTKIFLEFSNVGHERAAASVYASKRQDKIQSLDLYKTKEHALKSKFGTQVKKFENLDREDEVVYGWNKLAVDLVKHTIKGKYTFKGITTLKFQSAYTNLSMGQAQRTLAIEFEKFLLTNFTDLLKEEHSLSILKTVFGGIEDIFNSIKPKIRNILSPRSRIVPPKTRPLKKNNATKKAIFKAKVQPKQHAQLHLSITPDKEKLKKLFKDLDEEDFNSHIPTLNTLLHDKIQQNMGKGGSKKILNYRTGRFARSAQIEAFTPSKEKNALEATVKYMKNPYEIFEPSGKLFKPGRDPHRIFGRSIRQLLQEEKIATLRRVKVNLRD